MHTVLLYAVFALSAYKQATAGVLEGVENAFEQADSSLDKKLSMIHNSVVALYRQVMLQQLFLEERIRSDGDSGVKQVRHHSDGTRPYHSDSHTTGHRILAIHDHSNNIRTVGMGEFIGVLNGVEFRTRHNDYRLNMPHRTSTDWHATEPIPFPPVPPQVLNKPNVQQQVEEMREWFMAWRDQNTTVRDYRKYFRPNLCYLEGAWTSASGKIDEPFESDRHFVNAKSWFELQQKILFTSYTGRKDRRENLAFLPTTIMSLINETVPEFAQWNYRILCHPIKRDLPLNRFRVVDELQSRMSFKRTYTAHAGTRAARFHLNPFDTDKWKDGINNKKWGLLDELMGEIPGKENYQGNMTDSILGDEAYTLDPKKRGPLNAAFYHRKFKVLRRGAMGLQTRSRGYSDENLFMARTKHHKVAGVTLTECGWQKINGRWKRVCRDDHQKWSYAIPLEIIWMTPLNAWNPYKIPYKGNENTPHGKTVYAGGRWGSPTDVRLAFNGTNSRKYFVTPEAFFSGIEVGGDAADTVRRGSVGVLDKNGVLRRTRASGTRIFFPPIHGVGTLRQRYPIMPVHGEGASVWKELAALEDMIMMSQTNSHMFREVLSTTSDQGGSGPVVYVKPIKLQMTASTNAQITRHTHEIHLTAEQVMRLKNGELVNAVSSTSVGHQHSVQLKFDNNKQSAIFGFLIVKCEGATVNPYRNVACWDRHGTKLLKIS